MKSKTVRSILATSVLLGTILAGCGAEEEQPQSSDSTEKEKTNFSQEKADPLEKYEEPVTVTQVLGYMPPEDPKAPQGLTPDKNGYVDKLKEYLNIDLRYLWTVPTEQFEQKFSLSIASGDLPDIMVVGQNVFEKFKEQNLLADLSEVYPKYASHTLEKFMDFDGGETLKRFMSDGKLLGIPDYVDPYMSTQLMWIRTDWLENLQLQAPTSLEELIETAEAFVQNDPDQNGKPDTYGFAVSKKLISWGFDARGIFYTMGAYPNGWLKDADGKLVAGNIQPETRQALEMMSQWYAQGLLDKEFAFKDENKVAEDVIAGKVGIVFGEWWYPNWPLNLSKEKNPQAEWQAFPLPSFEGKPGKSLVDQLRLNNVMVVNKKFAHPEAAIKLANFYLEYPEKPNDTAENGFIYHWYEPRFNYPGFYEEEYLEVWDAIETGKTEIAQEYDLVLQNTRKYLSGDKNPSVWGSYFSRAAEDGGWGVTRQVRNQKQVTINEYAGPPTATQIEKGGSLDKLMDETFMKIILGSASIEEFDKYAESWKRLGGDDITKEVNEWYAKKNEN